MKSAVAFGIFLLFFVFLALALAVLYGVSSMRLLRAEALKLLNSSRMRRARPGVHA